MNENTPPVTVQFPTYKPSGFYFRRALRGTEDPKELRAIAMQILRELENVKTWARDEHGLIPPKRFLMQSELSEKAWPCA